MNDLFHSAKLRLSRGNYHITDFNERIRSFLQKPCTIIREDNLNGIHESQKITIKLTESIPDNFATIAADAIDNLRSALDHAWYAFSDASNALSADKRAYFPIPDNIRGLENFISTKGARYPKDIITLLREIEPYKGPNGYIWALNWICVKNKHRLIAPIATIANVEMIHTFSYGTAKQIDRPRFDSSKNEIIFYTPKGDTTVKYNVGITFDIAFHEAAIQHPGSASNILKIFTDIVNDVINGLERIARSLGYI
ncbi:MAG: hypothetical protein ABSC45_07855 [Desulfobaccales bacterium]|jgi:hypothetical protein